MVQRLWLWLVLGVLVSVGCQHTAVADDDVEDDDDMEDDDDSLEDDDHPLCQSFSRDECTETDVKTHCPSLCEHPLCKFYSSDECTETDVKTYCPSLCDSTSPTSNETGFATTPYGVRFNSPDRLIVGGTAVSQPYHHPWMALLLKSNDGSHFCGGVLITDRHVLTAAHCFHGIKNENDFYVRLGEYNLQRCQPHHGHLNYQVAKVNIHDNYVATLPPYRYDVAVVVIYGTAPNHPAIRHICIPRNPDDYTDKNALVTGWGKNFQTGQWAQVLQQLEVKIMDKDSCKAKNVHSIFPKRELCTMSLEVEGGTGSGVCHFDSGGPLIHPAYDVQHQVYRWTVVGIVSWGHQPCGSKFPDVYTRVDAYLRWIRETVGSSKLCQL